MHRDATTEARRERFTRPRSPDESIHEDIERYRGADLRCHGRDLEAVCRSVAETLRSHPDRTRVLAWQDPRSPEAEEVWMRRFRLDRSAGQVARP